MSSDAEAKTLATVAGELWELREAGWRIRVLYGYEMSADEEHVDICEMDHDEHPGYIVREKNRNVNVAILNAARRARNLMQYGDHYK